VTGFRINCLERVGGSADRCWLCQLLDAEIVCPSLRKGTAKWIEKGTNMNVICSAATFSGHTQYHQALSLDLLTRKSPWPQSASELYRPSDCRLSTKLVPTFCG
jgi:hypothetical protein